LLLMLLLLLVVVVVVMMIRSFLGLFLGGAAVRVLIFHDILTCSNHTDPDPPPKHTHILTPQGKEAESRPTTAASDATSALSPPGTGTSAGTGLISAQKKKDRAKLSVEDALRDGVSCGCSLFGLLSLFAVLFFTIVFVVVHLSFVVVHSSFVDLLDSLGLTPPGICRDLVLPVEMYKFLPEQQLKDWLHPTKAKSAPYVPPEKTPVAVKPKFGTSR